MLRVEPPSQGAREDMCPQPLPREPAGDPQGNRPHTVNDLTACTVLRPGKLSASLGQVRARSIRSGSRLPPRRSSSLRDRWANARLPRRCALCEQGPGGRVWCPADGWATLVGGVSRWQPACTLAGFPQTVTLQNRVQAQRGAPAGRAPALAFDVATSLAFGGPSLALPPHPWGWLFSPPVLRPPA